MSALTDPIDEEALLISQSKPVLKWVGSKRQLEAPILKAIARLHPDPIDTYYEPFAGGLAVFFALRRRLLIKQAVLSDTNEELINFYLQIQNAPEALIGALKKLKSEGHGGEKRYYAVRASKPQTDAARAARFKYINAEGYNGLWRVNKQNGCNVPWGRRKKPAEILDEDAIWAARDALSIATIRCEDYRAVVRDARGKRGLIYFDPPYWPTRPTANFTSYTVDDFRQPQQEELAQLFGELARSGRRPVALLSNSDVPGTRKLYADYTKQRLQARRNVNSDAAKRGAVSELLVESTLRK